MRHVAPTPYENPQTEVAQAWLRTVENHSHDHSGDPGYNPCIDPPMGAYLVEELILPEQSLFPTVRNTGPDVCRSTQDKRRRA